MSERSAVQNPMLKYAQEIGWEYVPPDEALRRREGAVGRFFVEDLAAQLQRLNPGIVDARQAGELVREMGQLPASLVGNRDALSWLRGERSRYVTAEKRELNLRLIDFSNLGNNLFHVTDEWRHQGVAYTNRADVVFLINGIPVALAETKAAGKRDGLAEGVDQVRRYHRETPEMVAMPQLFEVMELFGFFYGATWSLSRKNLFDWKEEEGGNYEQKVKRFFEPARILRVLREYIIFLTKDDVLTKVVLRQHQTRAVEKVLDRVADRDKRSGLIWHTQGSGKTLTMIAIAANLLRESPGEKPLVLMLVDRNELESQLFRNITGYGITPRVAQSKKDLIEILRSDYRGLVVSMIHKFDDIPARINSREGIVVLVDEAHRTTGGNLGTYLMAALPRATYIGFTGTPIDQSRQGRGTFDTFGGGDESGYLDKYSIKESVEDGTTLALNYALAPSEMRVERATLEQEFLKLAEAEGVSDVEELNAILDRAVQLKQMMKSPDRVNRIAAFVAEHFKTTIEPMGFKAFLVAVDREACALYYQALAPLMPEGSVQVIFSSSHNDSALLKQHALSAEAEKQVRKDFARKGSNPQILIVTEKLLTGYDAPILYCMYLDKPMRDHVLLQAIARVNRPYEDEGGLRKPYGFVLDFVGVFERLEDALAFDAATVGEVVQNLDVLRDRFALLMREQAPPYLPLTSGWDDKAKERAALHFENKETRETFFAFFQQLQTLYQVLSPDAALREYLKDFEALAALYAIVRAAYSTAPYVDRELTTKTQQLLRAHTSASDLALPGGIYALGPAQLDALKQGDLSDTTKLLNLRKLIAQLVEREGSTKPFLRPIGERAEELAKAYEERRLATEDALTAFLKLAEEYVAADATREALGVDANSYAIYLTLQSVHPDVTPEQANAINGLFERYPAYEWNDDSQRRLRVELYKVLYPLVGPERLISTANALIGLQRV